MVLMHQEKNEKLDIKLDIKRPVLPLWISFTQNIFVYALYNPKFVLPHNFFWRGFKLRTINPSASRTSSPADLHLPNKKRNPSYHT